MSSAARRIILLASVALGVGGISFVAFGWWTGGGSGNAVAAVATFGAPGTPSVSVTAYVASVSWSAASAPGAGAVDYHVERRETSDLIWRDVCGTTASIRITALECSDVPGDGTFEWRVTAFFHSWTATSGTSSVRHDRFQATDRLDHRTRERRKRRGDADGHFGFGRRRHRRGLRAIPDVPGRRGFMDESGGRRYDVAVFRELEHHDVQRRPLRPARDHHRQRRPDLHVANGDQRPGRQRRAERVAGSGERADRRVPERGQGVFQVERGRKLRLRRDGDRRRFRGGLGHIPELERRRLDDPQRRDGYHACGWALRLEHVPLG